MKSLLKKVVVVTMLSTSVLSFQATKSHAILGIVTGNIVLDCIGIITIGVGADIANSGINGPAELHRGRMTALLGLLILDDKTQMPAHYGPLTDAIASKLGLDPSKIDSYNEALTNINGIHQTIIGEVQALLQNPETSTLKNDKDIQNFARAEWKRIGSQKLNPEVQEVLQQIQG
jgi:hypothetical protein